MSRTEFLDLDILPQLIGYNIQRAQIAVYRDFMRSVEDYGMTPTQFAVLALVGANAGVSQVSLGKTLNVDRATIMAVVDKLQNRNLLERRPSVQDRRKQDLHLTAHGEESLQILRNRIHAHEARLTTQFSSDEGLELIRLLQKLQRSPRD
ncbi:MAG: MarR family transcriptional regulator [Gammaproteobacteria bacterium]|nr:MarR family transcriptional regulator [Gammaproteobacteria bacterium]